tara:strand:- start:362 stop:1117 length:756 start_codon:yes stop_codon:yes gene_type:complete
MFNSNFFYTLYEKLFMNDFLSIVVKIFNDKNGKFKNKNLVVFDIGSYKGTFSKQLQNKFGEKKISFYLFDPLKKLINFDNENLTNFYYFDYALDSTKPSKKKFYLNNFLHASGSSLKGTSFKDIKYRFSRSLIAFFLNPFKRMVKIIEVKTNNLDNFCKNKKIRKIDILKIDTEGTELDVLNGSKKMIKKINVICLEIQCSEKEFKRRLTCINKILNKDFKILYKKKIYIASIFTGIVSYDYVYVRKVILN